MKTSGSADKAPATVERKAKHPNKTEASYRTEVLDRQAAAGLLASIAYEALTIRLANGHRYTPDWVCRTVAGLTICIEVKGTYRMHSHQRARLAFDQAALEWPAWRWIWAEKQAVGGWRTIEQAQPVAATTEAPAQSCAALVAASGMGELPPPADRPGKKASSRLKGPSASRGPPTCLARSGYAAESTHRGLCRQFASRTPTTSGCAVHCSSGTAVSRVPRRVLPGQDGRDSSQRKVEPTGRVSFQTATETPPMNIEPWPIDRVKECARNPRKNAAAVDAVANSIREFGFRQPIVQEATR